MFRYTASFFIAAKVRQVFVKGTGCIVDFEKPRISLFPPGARLRNLRIHHPGETVDEGFFAERLSIGLDLSSLFRKRLMLKHLRLEGAHASGRGTETGFLNTIDFIVRDEIEDQNRPWHAFLTRGWKVRTTDLLITPPKSPEPNLTISIDDYSFIWQGLRYQMKFDNTAKPIGETHASAERFIIDHTGASPISIGKMEAHGIIGGGMVRLTQGTISDKGEVNEPNLVSTANLDGVIRFEEGEGYDISIRGMLRTPYLSNLIGGEAHDFSKLQPEVSIDAKILGQLLRPTSEGTFELFLQEPTFALVKREECALQQLAGHFVLHPDFLDLRELTASDIINEGTFHLIFDQPLTYSGRLGVGFHSESEFIQRCLGELMREDGRPADPASGEGVELAQAIVNSHSTLQVNGTLRPLMLQASLRTVLDEGDPSARAELQGELNFENELLAVRLHEVGESAQITPVPPLDPAAPPEEIETPFSTFERPRLELNLQYRLVEGELTISNFRFVEYPAQRLIRRAFPFLESDLARQLLSSTKPESRLNGSGKLTMNRSAPYPTGSLSLSLSDPQLGLFRGESISVKLSNSQSELLVEDLLLRTGGGDIGGNLKISEQKLSGVILGENIQLENLNLVQEHLPGMHGRARVNGTIAGSVTSPTYETTVQATTTLEREQARIMESKLSLHGDRNGFILEGSLLSDVATLTLNYPITGETKLSLNAKVNELPLELFIGSTELRTATAGDFRGSASGEFNYLSTRENPLSGEGKLVISRLVLQSDEGSLQNREPLIAVLRDGRLNFENIRLVDGEQHIELIGSLDQQAGWDAKFLWDWDLQPLLFQFPKLEQLSGKMNLAIELRGPFRSPEISGTVRVQNGSFSLPLGKTIFGANAIEIVGQFQEDTLTIQSIAGQSGGEAIFGSGHVKNIFDAVTREVLVTLQFPHIEVEPIDNLIVDVGGQLSITRSPHESLLLAGDIDIAGALYEDVINLKEVVAAISTTVTGIEAVERRASVTDAGAQLALHLTAPKAIIIETNVFRGELKGDVTVRGDTRTPLLGGSLEVLEGVFGFGSGEFDVVYGKVTFPERDYSVDPLLDIVGEGILKGQGEEEYEVQVAISGSITKPKVQFRSNSGLPERDLVYLLAFGGRFQEITALGSSRGAGDLTIGELMSPRSDLSFRERLAGITGFSELNIQAQSSKNPGEFVPSVSATRPLTDQTDVILSTELSSRQTSSAAIEYSLTRQLSLIGDWRTPPETDPDTSTGSFGAGLRYKKSYPGLRLFPPKRIESNK